MSNEELSFIPLAAISPADPNSLGWDVIDGQTWERLAGWVRLPSAARDDVVRIVREERAEYRRWKNCTQRPAEARRELERLRDLARKLADGLHQMGFRAQDAVVGARSDESDVQQRTLLGRFNKKLLDPDLTAVERWRIRLDRACQITKDWRAHGVDRSLRRVVSRLDALLLDHTGRGLVRASLRTKSPNGRAEADKQFVGEVVRLTIGARQSGTIDDAVKDTIRRRRRSVGNSSKKQITSTPHEKA